MHRFCFHHALSQPVQLFWNFCQANFYGVRIGRGNATDFHLGIILFADNFWLIAKNPKELVTTSDKWYDLLQQYGWRYPPSEYVYSTTCPDTFRIPKIIFRGSEVTRRTHKEGIKVLGSYICFDGSFGTELDFRIAKAWGLFWKFREVLCAFTQNLVQRIRILNKTVQKTLFYGSGSWHLTKSQINQLSGVQFKMIRKMIKFICKPWESMEFFMARTNGVIKTILDNNNFERWSDTYIRLTYTWAGSIGRLVQRDPPRILSQAAQWRNLDWLRHLESEYRGQCHPRKLKVWRWETRIARTCGEDWIKTAADYDHWNSLLSNL